MPRARNRQDRARQVLRWIESNWPIGRNVRLVFVDHILDDENRCELDGQCYREGREIVIEIAMKRNLTIKEIVDTICHEASHAILWPTARAEGMQAHHPPAFWAQYGEIRDRFDHDNGWEESKEYDF